MYSTQGGFLAYKEDMPRINNEEEAQMPSIPDWLNHIYLDGVEPDVNDLIRRAKAATDLDEALAQWRLATTSVSAAVKRRLDDVCEANHTDWSPLDLFRDKGKTDAFEDTDAYIDDHEDTEAYTDDAEDPFDKIYEMFKDYDLTARDMAHGSDGEHPIIRDMVCDKRGVWRVLDDNATHQQ
jgi:hypothetical protein